jgi:hypothetical protein
MAECKGGCGEKIEMHLADFNTAPDEVEVFCQNCMPTARIGGIVWNYKDSPKAKWQRVFVKALTENAVDNMDGNHPNASFTEEAGVPDGTLEVIDERKMQVQGKNSKHITRANRKVGRCRRAS